MTCGTCKHPFSRFVFLWIHWLQTGCARGREVWRRVIEARRRGTSGRRILHQAYPELYPSEPMPEEVKEQLRAKKGVAR